MNQQTTTRTPIEFNEVFPYIMVLNGITNGAKLMFTLSQMTREKYISWTTVRETGNFAQITGTDTEGTFSATITKVRDQDVSPIEIEISYQAQGFLKAKNEKIVLDPGNFTASVSVAVWRRAMEFFTPLHQQAIKNALTADVFKTSRASAN